MASSTDIDWAWAAGIFEGEGTIIHSPDGSFKPTYVSKGKK